MFLLVTSVQVVEKQVICTVSTRESLVFTKVFLLVRVLLSVVLQLELKLLVTVLYTLQNRCLTTRTTASRVRQLLYLVLVMLLFTLLKRLLSLVLRLLHSLTLTVGYMTRTAQISNMLRTSSSTEEVDLLNILKLTRTLNTTKVRVYGMLSVTSLFHVLLRTNLTKTMLRLLLLTAVSLLVKVLTCLLHQVLLTHS